jgi:MFS family permease
MTPTTGDTVSVWRPLRTPMFRRLLIADVASDIGTFMQSVGAAWLMVSLGAGPLLVALTQTASTLPFFVFALPAGALGDIVDRRKLILYTEAWMACVAIVLAIATLTGVITPWLLLALTFALSAGDAVETPTWRAVLPELVRREDLAAASALNGIEFNIARAIGPALAGALITAAGVGAAFLVNVVSFAGVIVVVLRWKRPVRVRTAPAESIGGATVAALRYIRYAPTARGVMLRAGAVMFCASAPFALLPTVAHRISGDAIGYGLLLGCFGAGAIGGAVVMQAARARWTTEAVASISVAILGGTIVLLGLMHTFPGLMLTLLISGAAHVHLARQCAGAESRARLGSRSRARDLHARHPGRTGRWQCAVGSDRIERRCGHGAAVGRRGHDHDDGPRAGGEIS